MGDHNLSNRDRLDYFTGIALQALIEIKKPDDTLFWKDKLASYAVLYAKSAIEAVDRQVKRDEVFSNKEVDTNGHNNKR